MQAVPLNAHVSIIENKVAIGKSECLTQPLQRHENENRTEPGEICMASPLPPFFEFLHFHAFICPQSLCATPFNLLLHTIYFQFYLLSFLFIFCLIFFFSI